MRINSLGQLKDSIDRVLSLIGIDSSDRVGDTIKLALVGATSVGKSRTINSIIGRDVCAVGHVGNTTREAYWTPFFLSESKQPDFELLDLPGWGISKRVDEQYKNILRDALPDADAILWILRADALGTLAYDLQWIQDIVLPSVNGNEKKIVVGLNQIENVYDKSFVHGKPSRTQIDTINNKCHLVLSEVQEVIPNFSLEQLHPYSAEQSHRVLPLLNSLVIAAGQKGWILQLISHVSKENDSFFL
jgi:predicted GTPase